ncbi:MAG: M48 family metalloprotease [Syntrophothermus sp.]
MKKLMFLLLLPLLIFSSCSKNDGGTPITVFSVNDDIALGNQIDQEILSKPNEYPVLDSNQYANAYSHLYQIRNTLLASGKVKYADKFSWRCRIIKNDSVINAFCVPGGHIYVYTGIIKFLDNEAEFAGVLAHEMGHADMRHTSEQLTAQYGVSILLSLVLGNDPNQIAQIAAQLAAGLGTLAYSRSMETEADVYSVKVLYQTKYDASAMANFFTKMQNQPQPPQFLSDHPSPENRVQKINETFNSLGGVHGGLFESDYQAFKASIP